MSDARALTVVAAVLISTAAVAAQPVWDEPATLVADDPREDARFGAAVAVDGTLAVVGAPDRPDPGSNAGAVHSFTRASGSWTEGPLLRPADIRSGDRFGAAVALDGDTLVVGAPGRSDHGPSAGGAYVFVRSDGTWSRQATLAPDERVQGDRFGQSLDLEGDTIVVGASGEDDPGIDSGAAYVFVRSGGTWSRQAQLEPGDLAEGDRFGASVAVDGETAIVTAPASDATEDLAGAAYAFTRSGGTWSEQARFQPDDVAESDVFGTAAALDGGTALVSATGDDEPSHSGAGYVFTRSDGAWTQQAKLTAADAKAGDRLGASVALDGSVALLGAPGRSGTGLETGVAVAFDGSTGWTQQAELSLAEPEDGDRFGQAVALDGRWALVGAPGADGGAADAGIVAAYGPPGTGDGADGGDGGGPVMPAAGVPAVVAGVAWALLARRR